MFLILTNTTSMFSKHHQLVVIPYGFHTEVLAQIATAPSLFFLSLFCYVVLLFFFYV